MRCLGTMKILAVTGFDESGRPDMTDCVECRDGAARALESLGHQVVAMDISPNDISDSAALGRRILDLDCHCVLNLFEGFGDDPSMEVAFSKLLETIGIPFTGNGSVTLENCLDKERTRKILTENKVPIPKGICVKSTDDVRLSSVSLPAFLKPSGEDGSVGIGTDSLICERSELLPAVRRMLDDFPKGVSVEEFIDGPEYAVAFMDNVPYRPLPVSRIDYDDFPEVPPYLDYRSKWDETSPSYGIAPKLGTITGEEEARIVDVASAAGRALGCRGPFRVDLRERSGELFVLDLNPNPCLSDDAGFVRQAQAGGIDRPALMENIARSAISRFLTEMAVETDAFSEDEVEVLSQVLHSWSDDPDLDYSLMLSRQKGKITGFAVYGRTPMTESAWDLYWIVVDRNSQGRGLGRRMVKELVNLVVEKDGGGVIRVETSGRDDYGYQRKFYVSSGFEETGRITNFYSKGDDLVTYCLYLDGGTYR